MRHLLLGFVVVGTAVAKPELTPASFETQVKPFFTKYCVDCHGPKKQKAKRRFDKLAYPIADDDALIDYQDALDLLNLGEMPPEDETQPKLQEKRAVIGWLTAAIAKVQAERDSTGGETVLRRLNRREYRNSVADLFGIDTVGFDPTEAFPLDQKVHHLDNQGHALVTSGFLLEQYLKAAETVIDKAMPPQEKPKSERRVFDGKFFQQPELDSRLAGNEADEIREAYQKKLRNPMRALANASTKKELEHRRDWAAGITREMLEKTARAPSTLRLYERPDAARHMGSYGFIHALRHGVPHDGFYKIELELSALHRQSEYARKHAKTNPDEPMVMAIVPGDLRFSDLHLPQPIEPELARFVLKDGKQKVQTTVYLHKGTTPRFAWLNGSPGMRKAHIDVGRILRGKDGKGYGIETEDAFRHGLRHAELPHIRIHEAVVTGPLAKDWPTATHRKLLGGGQYNPDSLRATLKKNLGRIYRRPPSDDEMARIERLVTARRAQGRSAYDAYRDGLKAALCSPAFLYLDEPAGDNGRLNNYALASRLSYYLWSSTPDEQLLKLAGEGRLGDDKVLSQQLDRMLRDPKSNRFVNDFLDGWLTLRALGNTPPDRGAFRRYYDDYLESAMLTETRTFTRHLLDENLPIDLFLDSDFSFVNAGLAKLYKLDVKIPKEGFHRVSLKNSPRGGLLGQASVLTVTANGVDTSPVVRGVWLLENILGTPPSPPPPDVEPLDPDVRGAKSIRDQLEKHRNNESCAECHRKIDPLGFALENFDAIGQWRGNYGKRVKIDPSGKMPGGTAFENFGGFKKALLQEKHKFARSLTEKLMAHALGRQVEIRDRPEIDAILADLDDNHRGFRFLVKRIVLSDAFRSP